ncbi:MAG: hypothetical protein PVJ57_13910 [Phycisphaerae bacterium]|jgi:hypothetical protein
MTADTPRPGRRLCECLRLLCLVAGLAVLAYPFLPATWFVAVNPADGEPLLIHQSHATRAPLHLLWALEGFRRVPLAARAGLVVLLAALAWWPARPRTENASRFELWRRRRWPVAVAAVVAVGVFWLARVSPAQNDLFADAPILPAETDLDPLASEVLTYHVFHAVRGVLTLFTDSADSRQAIVVTSCLAGDVFLVSLLILARAASRTGGEWLMLLGGGALAGYTAMFFGYVETTQVELAAMTLYLGAAAAVLHGPPGPQRRPWLLLALAALALATMAHAAGLLLLPSAAVLLVGESAGEERTAGQALRRTLSVRNVAAVGLLVVLPYVLVIVLPFYARGLVGNITGGGDEIMFVPWHVDPAAPPSRYVYYAMLSWWHAADLLSAVLVAAPLAVPLLIGAGVCVWRRRERLERQDRWWLGLLAVAAGPCALVPLLWNHDFGMRGDWNLAACYLFPLNMLGWSLLAVLLRGSPAGWGRRVVTPLLLVQLVLGVGILLQLW